MVRVYDICSTEVLGSLLTGMWLVSSAEGKLNELYPRYTDFPQIPGSVQTHASVTRVPKVKQCLQEWAFDSRSGSQIPFLDVVGVEELLIQL